MSIVAAQLPTSDSIAAATIAGASAGRTKPFFTARLVARLTAFTIR
jgi:hypothetical protein